MHSIVDSKKQMIEVLLQERHLRTFILPQAAHDMGDSETLQLLNALLVWPSAEIQSWRDLTAEALTQVYGEVESEAEPREHAVCELTEHGFPWAFSSQAVRPPQNLPLSFFHSVGAGISSIVFQCSTSLLSATRNRS